MTEVEPNEVVESEATPEKKRRWVLRGAALALLLIALSVGGLSCVWRSQFYHGTTGSAPCDPVTGVMQGAEEIRLEGGNRRACLMLHGWLTTPADFGELPARIAAAGWDVYAPHMKGHCTHPREMVNLTADDIMDKARADYAALRKRYDEVTVVGFSMGGAVALLLGAEDAPPEKLVLVAPYVGIRHKWYYVLPARWWHSIVSPVVPYIGRGKSILRINRKEGLPGLITYTVYPTSANDAVFELRRRALAAAAEGRPAGPTLMLYASGDDVCSPRAERRMFEQLPHAANRAFVAPKSNHHILNDYDREEAIQSVLGFLNADGR
jgi:carboxylesterase